MNEKSASRKPQSSNHLSKQTNSSKAQTLYDYLNLNIFKNEGYSKCTMVRNLLVNKLRIL